MAPKKIRKKTTDFTAQAMQILEDEETPIHAEVLIPQTVAKSGMALGPAFDGEFPSPLYAYYPLAEEALPFESVDPDWSVYHKPNPNRLWPRPDKEYLAWLDRVSEAKGQLWKSIGIYGAIMLSRSAINIDNALFFAAAQFWSITTNSFHFKVGMMGPTMQDISFLTGLRAHGVEANCFLSQKTPVFEYPVSEFLAYTRFVPYFHGEGDVTEEEHVAFLLYWLNKFIFCVSSSRVTKDFTDLAKALASGRKLAMAPLILAYLYRGMYDLLENRYVFAAGPLWIVTLWLWAYFPTLGPSPIKFPEHTCYGLHFRDIAPRKHTFEACFRYFYADLASMGAGWMPFDRDTAPTWLKTNPADFEENDDEQKEIWASFLVSRDLLYGLSAQSKNEKSGVEFYNAAQFARQFGLLQLIPLPPYESLNTNFTQRPILELKSLEKVKDVFEKSKANFELLPFPEFPEKSDEFNTWWKDYTKPLFSKSVKEILKVISPPPPPEPKKSSSKAKTTSVTSSKRKSFEEEEVEEQEQATKKAKTLPGPSSKAATGKAQPSKVTKAVIAGRTRGSSTRSLDKEGSPPTPASKKGVGSKTAKSAPAKTKKTQELDDSDSLDKLDGSKMDTQTTLSSQETSKELSPDEKKPVLLDLDDESFDKFFQTVEELVKPTASGASGSGIGSSTPASYTPEEVHQAKEILKVALGLGVGPALHQEQYSSVRKSMVILVKSQALGGQAEPALQSFLRDFPNLKRSYELATDKRILATSKLTRIDELQQELKQGIGARDQLKTEIGEAKARRKVLLSTIEELEKQLSEARQNLTDHDQHEALLLQRRQELLDAAQGPYDALQTLMIERPTVEASKEQAEAVINDAVVAWDGLKASLENEL